MTVSIDKKINGFLLVKVGSDIKPATNADIDDVVKSFDVIHKKYPDLPIVVSHHAIEVQYITLEPETTI